MGRPSAGSFRHLSAGFGIHSASLEDAGVREWFAVVKSSLVDHVLLLQAGGSRQGDYSGSTQLRISEAHVDASDISSASVASAAPAGGTNWL